MRERSALPDGEHHGSVVLSQMRLGERLSGQGRAGPHHRLNQPGVRGFEVLVTPPYAHAESHSGVVLELVDRAQIPFDAKNVVFAKHGLSSRAQGVVAAGDLENFDPKLFDERRRCQ